MYDLHFNTSFFPYFYDESTSMEDLHLCPSFVLIISFM